MRDFATKTVILEGKVQAFDDEIGESLTDLEGKCDQIVDAAQEVAKSWSGSFIGYHADLYYADFRPPPFEEQFNSMWGGRAGIPFGWQPRTSEEVQSHLETLAGVKVKEVDGATQQLVDKAKDLQDEIQIGLVGLAENGLFQREHLLLQGLEKSHWGISAHKFLNRLTPSSIASRDEAAVVQGIRVPVHLALLTTALASKSRCAAIRDFLKAVRRLLRQVQERASQQIGIAQGGSANAHALVERVCRRFRLVARQLVHRKLGSAQESVRRPQGLGILGGCGG